MNDPDVSRILRALSRLRHPLTDETLTQQSAWKLLNHPAVKRALQQAAESKGERTDNPVPQPPLAKRRFFVRIVVPLLLVWAGVLTVWGVHRYTHRAGSVHDPALGHFRSTVTVPVRERRLMQLYRALHAYQQADTRNGARHTTSMPNHFDSLTRLPSGSLLPLVSTRAFASLPLDRATAAQLNEAGLRHLRVVSEDPALNAHCDDIDSPLWYWHSWRHADAASNLHRSPAAGGCGRIEPVAVGSRVAVWAGHTVDVDESRGSTDVAIRSAGSSAVGGGGTSTRMVDLVATANGTPLFLALGIGPSCTLFDRSPAGRPASPIRFPPIDGGIASSRYGRFIALYHFADVVDGRVQARKRIELVRIVNGDGQAMPRVGRGRNTI